MNLDIQMKQQKHLVKIMQAYLKPHCNLAVCAYFAATHAYTDTHSCMVITHICRSLRGVFISLKIELWDMLTG